MSSSNQQWVEIFLNKRFLIRTYKIIRRYRQALESGVGICNCRPQDPKSPRSNPNQVPLHWVQETQLILLEITYRISAEPKICMKSTMHGRSPCTVDFKEMTQESRFEGGHRPKIEIRGSSRQNICRRRDPKCNFDLIPKRNIKNQWKKFVMFQDLAISLHGKNDIARESRAISVLNCSDIVVQVSFCYRYQ